MKKALSSGETVNTGEYQIACRNGSARICELYASFIKDGLVVTFNDITERKRVEEAMRESKERFTLAINGTGAGLWDWCYFPPKMSVFWQRRLSVFS